MSLDAIIFGAKILRVTNTKYVWTERRSHELPAVHVRFEPTMLERKRPKILDDYVYVQIV